MIRQLLIALGVMSLELGYQGVGLAFTCPDQPKQISKDFEGEVNTAVGKIGQRWPRLVGQNVPFLKWRLAVV